MKVEQIIALLGECSSDQREQVFRLLRKEFKIHPIEDKLGISAEIILEALGKDQKGLTLRMIRGVIAEAAFDIEVLKQIKKWNDITPDGDLPYDYLVSDGHGEVKVQIKLQRSRNLKPMMANEAARAYSSELFVVETQKTRGGIDKTTNEDTRPYRYGEFDILAVSMQPSTGNWGSFLYTVSDWLLPRENEPTKMNKFQPVPAKPNQFWTDKFDECVLWYREHREQRIPY
jgi:hypothetical protein